MRQGKIFLYLIFFASGAAGLAAEIIWAQTFSLGLGQEFRVLREQMNLNLLLLLALAPRTEIREAVGF